MTDSLAYEQRVRDFHAALRRYYYPRLFRDEVVTDASLGQRPEFAQWAGEASVGD